MRSNKGGEESLSSHTIALRKAFQDCSDGVTRLRIAYECNGCISFSNRKRRASSSSELIRQAHAAAEAWREHRKQGIIDTLRLLDMAEENSSLSKVDIVQFDQDLMSPYEFKQKYCTRNIPCIIRGLDVTDFAYVSSQWRSDDGCINTEWFRRHVGGDTIVPVRINNRNNQNDDDLDGDGRAVECTTVEMKLDTWIQCCRQSKDTISNCLHEVQASESLQSTSTDYLKDWHLVQFLSDRQYQYIHKRTLQCPLYSLPAIFERDLLNNFLSKYTSGDYKFVYWGPPQSRTALHSDVLHSFSWSYNVVGKKHWKFYIPNDDIEEETRSFELIQETGETMFVPAKWKHEVTNLTETLSINHNWITTRNIDCTYECLLTEISSIENEIQKWGVVSDDDFEARENMLRGCVGMDLSMLVLMALLELTELLNFVSGEQQNAVIVSRIIDEDLMLDCLHGIFCLKNMLNKIMLDNDKRYINVMMRLTATLNSKAMAIDTVDYLKWCLDLINTMI